MNQTPLRYRISNLRQLTGCLSNNSRELAIHVTEFYNNYPFRGLRISVDHEVLGSLFACVINARGDIVTNYKEQAMMHEFTVDEILSEIEKYGFYVTYDPKSNLDGNQIQYLMNINQFGYDKIRVMYVWDAPIGVKETNWYVVAFRSKKHPSWLNNSYSASKSEFNKALLDGSAMNITELCECHKFRWDWLDYVANIDDIILDNSGDDYVSQYRRS